MSQLNFFVVDQGEPKAVVYDSEMVVEDFIKDYLKKNNDYVTINTEVYVFMVSGKIINSDALKNKKLKELVRPRARIMLERKKDVTYGKNLNKLIILFLLLF